MGTKDWIDVIINSIEAVGTLFALGLGIRAYIKDKKNDRMFDIEIPTKSFTFVFKWIKTEDGAMEDNLFLEFYMNFKNYIAMDLQVQHIKTNKTPSAVIIFSKDINDTVIPAFATQSCVFQLYITKAAKAEGSAQTGSQKLIHAISQIHKTHEDKVQYEERKKIVGEFWESCEINAITIFTNRGEKQIKFNKKERKSIKERLVNNLREMDAYTTLRHNTMHRVKTQIDFPTP